jgi:polysaccharide deacetylase 2 family uncharacterized protein YibQ
MSDQTHNTFTLPPRRESFIARYPRNFKMTVTVIIFAILVLPPAFIHNRFHHVAAVVHAPSSSGASDDTYLPTINNTVADTDVKAPSLNDQDDRSVKLTPSPDSRVTEDTVDGSLPRISEDGLRPWQIYARPFNPADKRPRIAIVVTGLGLSRTITDETINQLPPTVTLSFDTQGPVLAAWCVRARQDGHEILLEVPMEPFDYPRSDPGPDTLLTSLPNSDNIARLLGAMRRATGYVGLTTTSGSRFTTDSTKLAPVLQIVRDRGLMMLDARAAPHSAVADMARNATIPVATATQRLDGDLSPEAITAALDNLEKTARQSGRAIGITTATPIMIAQLQAWAKTLPQHGIALAPVSAMVQ